MRMRARANNHAGVVEVQGGAAARLRGAQGSHGARPVGVSGQGSTRSSVRARAYGQDKVGQRGQAGVHGVDPMLQLRNTRAFRVKARAL